MLYLLPFLLNGQELYITVYDNLDSNVVWLKTLATSGKIFSPSDTLLPQMMNGLPRAVFGTEFNVIVWLYALFEPFTAYVLNEFLLRIVAFFGMYALLQRYLTLSLEPNTARLLVTAIALLFSLLPFWPSGGLSVAAQPLVLYAFLNFHFKTHTYRDWLIIISVPFYSSFVLAFFFFLSLVFFFFLFDWVKQKKPNMIFISAFILMVIIYMLIDYRLVYSMFFDHAYMSHRLEFVRQYYDFHTAMAKSMDFFIIVQEHAYALQQLIIIPFMLFAMLLSYFPKPLTTRESIWAFVVLALIYFLQFLHHLLEMPGLYVVFVVLAIYAIILNKRDKLFYGLIFLQVSIAFWYGFWLYEGWHALAKHLPFLEMFHLSRYYWLAPLLWFLIIAFSLKMVIKKLKLGIYLALVALVIQGVYSFEHRTFAQAKGYEPTFNSFYAPELFEQVVAYIGQDQEDYRVVSIGLHPAIAQYNGFYTLDAYMVNYPLAYKHAFRKIISAELQKDSQAKVLFEHWGSRCYLFSSEVGSNVTIRRRGLVIKNLDINTTQLLKMGGKYLFSQYPIKNASENQLHFLKHFTHSASYWELYLYQIIHP